MTISALLALPDTPLVVVDEQGLICHVSPSFVTAFGWRADELVGDCLTRLVPQHLHDAHHVGFARFLATGTGELMGRPLRLTAVAGDGRELPTEQTIYAEQGPAGWTFAAVMRPV